MSVTVDQIQETDGSDRHTEFGITTTDASGLPKTVWRRYSQFKYLYEMLPGLKEALEPFPNKSILHTFSDATVERRRAYFDQMMKKLESVADFKVNPLYQQFMDPYFDFPTQVSSK